MVKVIGPLSSHDASGSVRAPRIFSSSLRNRQDREAPPTPPPPAGGSLLFTDTTDACNAPTINHTDQFPGTTEAWVRPTAYAGFIAGTYFDFQRGGAGLDIDATNLRSRFGFNDTWGTNNRAHSLLLNAWTHVAITWTTGTTTIWENGINIGNGTTFPRTLSHHSGYTIGGNGEWTWPKLEAYVTQVRFSDIIRYASNFTPATDFTNDANTIGLWKMKEGTGTTVADESGNGHTQNFPATNPPTWSDLVP